MRTDVTQQTLQMTDPCVEEAPRMMNERDPVTPTDPFMYSHSCFFPTKTDQFNRNMIKDHETKRGSLDESPGGQCVLDLLR